MSSTLLNNDLNFQTKIISRISHFLYKHFKILVPSSKESEICSKKDSKSNIKSDGIREQLADSFSKIYLMFLI